MTDSTSLIADSPRDLVPLWEGKADNSTTVSMSTLLSYLEKYGNHSMAYSTLQPGMKYYHVPNQGYVPYMKKWGRKYVLGGPICSEQDKEALLGNFLSEHNKVCFVQVYESDAVLLRDVFGFRITQLGIETWIDLPRWNIKGDKKALFRKYRNHAIKLGIQVREVQDHELASLSEQITALKKVWLEQCQVNNKAIKFLVRPEQRQEPATRRFIGFMGKDTLVSYIVCDPLYDEGKLFGYNINLSYYYPRISYPGCDPKYFQGVNYYTISEILNALKLEGLQSATLGLSPLRDLQPTPSEHFGLRKVLELLYEHGNRFYSFKGLAQHKKTYHGEEKKVFGASKSSGFFDMLAVMHLSNII